ncbi:MAG: hypothetical protein LBD22_04425 [Spirochaetaceae bacterium]|nr:hypothetical protein [Spirochaetaceae bacterium]
MRILITEQQISVVVKIKNITQKPKRKAGAIIRALTNEHSVLRKRILEALHLVSARAASEYEI